MYCCLKSAANAPASRCRAVVGAITNAFSPTHTHAHTHAIRNAVWPRLPVRVVPDARFIRAASSASSSTRIVHVRDAASGAAELDFLSTHSHTLGRWIRALKHQFPVDRSQPPPAAVAAAGARPSGAGAGMSGSTRSPGEATAPSARSHTHTHTHVDASVRKRPSDSLVTVILPFGSNPAFRKKYVNFRGHVRVGLLLEELDAIAGCCAYLHASEEDTHTHAGETVAGAEGGASQTPLFDADPPVLVTASLDRVDLLNYPLPADVDMCLRGCVTYAGTSSMNVELDLSTLAPGTDAAALSSSISESVGAGAVLATNEIQPGTPLMQASLTFVARDGTNRAMPVPQLLCETDQEKAMYERGRHAQQLRKQARGESLLKIPPTASELALVHQLFMQLNTIAQRDNSGALVLPPSAKLDGRPVMFMEHTRMSSVVVTNPQQQNIHGRVFGGFLLREAFEVAWACGWATTGVVPKFLAIDNVAFLAPVEIGRLVRFDAQVDYTDVDGGKLFSVSVSASMLDAAEDGTDKTTTQFHFTFYCEEPTRMPRVLPRTYEDAMRYIDADRRRRMGAALAAQRKADPGNLKPRF